MIVHDNVGCNRHSIETSATGEVVSVIICFISSRIDCTLRHIVFALHVNQGFVEFLTTRYCIHIDTVGYRLPVPGTT